MFALSRVVQPLVMLAVVFVLAACGGGGGSSDQAQTFTVQGNVANGPLVGSTVQVFGANAGGVLGSATTDADGSYAAEVSRGGPYRLRATGGLMNGVYYTGVLEALCASGAGCDVTPYTTVLLRLVDDHGFNVGGAASHLAVISGLDGDPFVESVPAEVFDLDAARQAIAGGDRLAAWVVGMVDWASDESAEPPPGVSAPPPTEPPPPPVENRAPVITGFQSSALQSAPGETVTFSWTATDPDGDRLRCTLDVTRAGPEFVIEDCAGARTQAFTYADAGTYLPHLQVSDGRLTATATLTQRVVSDFMVSILRPSAGALSDTPLEVRATVVSPLEVSRVWAEVAGRSTLLTFSAEEREFRGTLSLQGLPRGAQVLEVGAEDVSGRVTRAERSFVYDQLPTLAVTAPLPDTVTSRWIRVAATCSDDDPAGCELRVFDGGSAKLLATARDALGEEVDLAAYDGRAVTLRIEARDSAGQRRSESRRVFVDGSTALIGQQDFPGLVLDLRAARVLNREALASGDRLEIADGALGGVTLVPLPAGKRVSESHSFLTGFGAIFVAQDVGGTVLSSQVYDWNRGELEALGMPNSASSLAVAGDYAIWNTSLRLTRRDLAAREHLEISRRAGNWQNSVAANGAVAFWNQDYQVEFYRDGESRLLASDIGLWNTYTATDGERVMYRKHTPCCGNQTYAIILHDGTRETVLREAASLEPWPGRSFQLVPGWAAYTDVGNLGQAHVWSYGPTGERRQLTFFGVSSAIDALAPTGAVMLTNGGRRYLAEPDGELREISSSLGKAYWIDGGWRVAIGRSVFTVLP